MPSITVTGLDESVPLTRRTVDCLQGAEVGILLSLTPEGRNRYPRVEWIEEALAFLGANGIDTAVHICGSAARRALLIGDLDHVLDTATRIQVNGAVSQKDLAFLCYAYECQIITQDNVANRPLRDVSIDDHAILVDGSGGRGISPKEWVRTPTKKLVGFAGGLGPNNLDAELSKIWIAADGNNFWVDMEGRLRTKDDWFSLQDAQAAIQVFHNYFANGSARLLKAIYGE